MEEKSDLAFTVLESLQKAGILSDLILIGSWCHLFYKHYFNDAPEIPLVRTLDMDFLIPRQRRTHKEVNIPQLLSQMGFETVVSYPSGYKKFIHPDLTVEFLVQNDEQQKKLIKIYMSFRKKWQDKIKTSAREVSPVLFQLLTSL